MPVLLAPDCIQTLRTKLVPERVQSQWTSGTYRDGEIVPHVPPHNAVPEEVDPPPTFAGFLPVYEPPCSIEGTDQPKTSEEEYDEGSCTALC